jgi:hypothetical protein
MKANEMHYFSNLFDSVLYVFRTDPLSIIKEYLNTVYTQQIFVILVLLASAFIIRIYHDARSSECQTG